MIKESTTLQEILQIPGGEEILKRHGVPCMTCPFAASEVNSLQIGQVAKIYNLDLAKILEDLNKNLFKK